LIVLYRKFFGTGETFLLARTPFDFYFEIVPRGTVGKSVKGESERILVDIGKFSNAQADSDDVRVWATTGFRFHCFQNRGCNADFVQRLLLADARELISREQVYDAGSAEGRTHDHHARMIGSNVANDTGAFAKRVALQGSQRFLRDARGKDGY